MADRGCPLSRGGRLHAEPSCARGLHFRSWRHQALRSDLKSDEAPTEGEGPFPDWSLAEFDDAGPPRYLRLVPRYPGVQSGPDSLYLYEVNCSALAGVIRANHPIDPTQLLLGFDLANSVSRHRLQRDLRSSDQQGALQRERLVAGQVQRLASVLVAATVPILGLPALVFRQFTRNFVGAFSRFFEAIVTFALDKNGEQLISKHVDRTLRHFGVRFLAGGHLSAYVGVGSGASDCLSVAAGGDRLSGVLRTSSLWGADEAIARRDAAGATSVERLALPALQASIAIAAAFGAHSLSADQTAVGIHSGAHGHGLFP